MFALIGEMAAFGTAICYTLNGVCFEIAGKKVGLLAVNFIRLVIGFFLLSIFTYFSRGQLLPTDASLHNWIFLGISGTLGFFIGDIFLFQSYLEIGTRIGMLIMATNPPITAILGYIFLGETISITGILGMMLTMFGISLVILNKDTNEKKIKINYSIKGIIYAFLGALGQAIGMIFSKIGIGDYSPLAATQIRIIAGFIGFLILFQYMGRWSDLKVAVKDKKSMKFISLGALFGPFIGVSLQLLSLQHTTAGISATITSIMPITILPFSIFLYKEKIKFREFLGAFISIAGIAILFLK